MTCSSSARAWMRRWFPPKEATVAPAVGLRLRIAFFEGESLLAAGTLDFGLDEQETTFESSEGHRFEITYAFEEPACPMFVACRLNDEPLYRSASRVGVANSGDWERIDLVGGHCMVFKRVVADDPDRKKA